MVAANLLALERPNIFWTSCVTHTLNLMIGGISKHSNFEGVIDKAKVFTIFIYVHHKTLANEKVYKKKRSFARESLGLQLLS